MLSSAVLPPSFTEEGMREIQQNLDYYAPTLPSSPPPWTRPVCGTAAVKNSPYIWLRCPNNMGSWEFFDWLLETANVVGTPGEGFGPCGKGYFRLTAFGDASPHQRGCCPHQGRLAAL